MEDWTLKRHYFRSEMEGLQQEKRKVEWDYYPNLGFARCFLNDDSLHLDNTEQFICGALRHELFHLTFNATPPTGRTEVSIPIFQIKKQMIQKRQVTSPKSHSKIPHPYPALSKVGFLFLLYLLHSPLNLVF